MAHSSGGHFECNIGELGRVFKWPTQVVDILGVEQGGVFKWPTQVVDILGAILGNRVGYLNGPLKWWTFWVQY
jgi:hypothetical protein